MTSSREDPAWLTALQSEDITLSIQQDPERARVATGKEKERKPVDPPPIVQLEVSQGVDPDDNYLQSPFLFMCCALWHETEDKPADVDQSTALAGTLVSSLHRLKDKNNVDGAYFVFGDLSVRVEGTFRLKFNLFEMKQDRVVYLKSVLSKPFQVMSPKNFPGMAESSFLSRSFADQGVKLRIRKDSRTLLGNRKRALPQDDYPSVQTRSPDRPSVSTLPSSQLNNYQPSNRDYSYYPGGTEVKRQRSSVDIGGGRGSYDNEGRYTTRQVDSYQTTPAAYQTAPAAYRGSIMPGYPVSGMSGGYSVGNSSQQGTPSGSYTSSEEHMMAMRSPGGTYMAQPRFSYPSAQQVPYSMGSSSQLPQVGEPSPRSLVMVADVKKQPM